MMEHRARGQGNQCLWARAWPSAGTRRPWEEASRTDVSRQTGSSSWPACAHPRAGPHAAICEKNSLPAANVRASSSQFFPSGERARAHFLKHRPLLTAEKPAEALHCPPVSARRSSPKPRFPGAFVAALSPVWASWFWVQHIAPGLANTPPRPSASLQLHPMQALPAPAQSLSSDTITP